MERLWLGVDALDFLHKEGFKVLETRLAKDESEAAGIASMIGFPVALKISSPDVVHKTETGGIRVFLKTEGEVRQAFKEIISAFQSDSPEKQLDGAMVQKLGRGFELIVGTQKDPQFGPVLMLGLGGIYAEAFKDVSFRLIPVRRADVREMMEELRSYRALENPRNGTIDLKSLEDFLLRVSALMEKHPEIQEMDMNPIFVGSEEIEICDARIRLGTA
jgi:acyl-CoA synthetase (NDP forming)